VNLNIKLETIHKGYDRNSCWVHPRAGVIPRPSSPPIAVMTMSGLRLSGMDVFSPINEMRSDDGGATWSSPVEHSETLGRRKTGEDQEEGVCDWWPSWHENSGKLLGIGHTVLYYKDSIPGTARPRSTAYSTYDSAEGIWTPWRKLETPDTPEFFNEGAGSAQRLDLPNGDILLPIYFYAPGTFQPGRNQDSEYDGHRMRYAVTVMRCAFDGSDLKYREHGSILEDPESRGYVEPSLACFNGRYFLTLRHDNFGAVTSGADGLHFDAPKRWTFDDGTDLGNYNTQQHWVVMRSGLYLVYTRKGAKNDHVFRHRAPLFIAEVDTDRLCVIRSTERILVPERGARLGNFGVTRISDTESWVTVSEWMQTTLPDPYDCTICEEYGSDNSIFLVRITEA
jgi:hypothetical protein